MHRFLKKIIILVTLLSALFVIYCNVAEVATKKFYGNDTEAQVRMSFKNSVKEDYNCYFLGNSRIYRNINPEKFDKVYAYNFGHDNDSYNQMYYKLLYLIQNGADIDYLIIGTDYFQFSFLSDTRNYIYGELFPTEYMQDFSGNNTKFDMFTEKIKRLWINKQNALGACVKYITGRPSPSTVNYQMDNGQYHVEGAATGTETIDRDYTILDIQYDYYEKIIELCCEKNIDLYVVMPPLWEAEVSSHTDQERQVFNQMIIDSLKETPFEGHYINYSDINGLSSYEDFIDITHLSPSASDQYSTYLNTLIFD